MYKGRLLAALSLAAFTLSAIAAGSAQAGWIVLGSPLAKSATIGTKSTDKAARLHYSTATVECSSISLGGGEVDAPSQILVNSLELGGCSVTEPATCKLTGTTINSLPLEALATLDGSLGFKAKIKPKTGELLATFKLEGTSCSLSGRQAASGTATLLSPEGQDERLLHLVNLLIETAGELEVGSAAAELSGSTLVCWESDMTWRFS
jgi:hypothetical protein